MKKTQTFLYFLFTLILVGCAKRGSISGGLKDTIPPILEMSIPKNFSTEFSSKSIKLTFDEFVKLKNINKQLIISPPLSKNPQILPSTASKSITINFLDSLRTNTTYSMNFGQSIEDNNEGNPYPQFKYVFSTGKFIDSLSIQGTIKDALELKPTATITVMLYEVNEKYEDSSIFKVNPNYIAFSLEKDSSFKIDNIKAGKYVLVALDDKSSNYRFDPKTEKIGFWNTAITVPNDSLFEIKLFKETPKLKLFKPTQSSANSATFGYEGDVKDLKITLKKGKDLIKAITTQVPKKDSLQIWFKPFQIEKSAVDSLQLYAIKEDFHSDFTFKIKAQKQDTLSISAISPSILPLSDDFLLRTSLPLSKIDESKIKLIRKDSTAVPFKIEYDELSLSVKVVFQKDPMEKFYLELSPYSVVDFLGETIKLPLKFDFETKNVADYGNLRLNLENVKHFPVIIELTDKNGVVQYTRFVESNPQIDFNLIKPDVYTLRLIYDLNKNKVWDSGNFLEKKQPEKVVYFPKDIDVRANWDVEQTFILKE